MANAIVIILGGGKGTRLYPLTKNRAKPAVPFAGKYRLIDLPMSNCINSGFKQIYILTQFNTASLHTHLSRTYIFDSFTNGFVEILSAEQTFENSTWYEGTADAVRKNFQHFNTHKPTHYIIFSGDQLYRMDLGKMLDHHIERNAEITIAGTPVGRKRASNLGILKSDSSYRVVDFREKPGGDSDISDMIFPRNFLREEEKKYLGSMGMYIFNADILERALNNDCKDFGREIIPSAIADYRVYSYLFRGYWEDIGTIKAFYETHIDLASQTPSFEFYDEKMPIFTVRRHLPSTKILNCSIYRSLAAEGSIITDSSILNSVIGVRTLIEAGALLDGVVYMGVDYYETPEQLSMNSLQGIPNIGIGKDTVIRKAIIDMNTRIGSNCRIGVDPVDRIDGDYGTYFIRDGIIIIPKNSTLPSGTVI